MTLNQSKLYSKTSTKDTHIKWHKNRKNIIYNFALTTMLNFNNFSYLFHFFNTNLVNQTKDDKNKIKNNRET